MCNKERGEGEGGRCERGSARRDHTRYTAWLMQPILIILQITLSYSEFPRNLINSVDVAGDFSASALVFQSLLERIEDV